MKYELVVGVETHVELSTKSKIFCSCTTEYGGNPNTHCCPVCIGLPGTMPTLNRQAIYSAVKAGLATNCSINNLSEMDRKNYFYPDLPKAYQITQNKHPLCENGYVKLQNGRHIRIERIQVEEDAGRLIHRGSDTYVDYNRAGVPLIEIVTKPDFRSSSEVTEYVSYLQRLMRYIGVSDCRMQEGSLRCDVNISVRPEGTEAYGIRTEVKNMNSITNMGKAVDSEYKRHCEILESGGEIKQQTLRYDDDTGEMTAMRSKEHTGEYRFFREPDLPKIYITDEEIEKLRDELPELPLSKAARYERDFGISYEDARLLTGYRAVSEYFDKAAALVQNPRTVSNFILQQLFSTMPSESAKELFEVSVSAEELAKLCNLLEQGKITNNLAKITLSKMMEQGLAVSDLLTEEDMGGLDDDTLTALCKKAVEENGDAVKDFKNGKTKALKAVLGTVMRESHGKASAVRAEEILLSILK